MIDLINGMTQDGERLDRQSLKTAARRLSIQRYTLTSELKQQEPDEGYLAGLLRVAAVTGTVALAAVTGAADGLAGSVADQLRADAQTIQDCATEARGTQDQSRASEEHRSLAEITSELRTIAGALRHDAFLADASRELTIGDLEYELNVKVREILDAIDSVKSGRHGRTVVRHRSRILLEELENLQGRLNESIDPRGSIRVLADEIEDLVRRIAREH